MKRKGLMMNVGLVVFLLLGALAVLLNAYSVHVTRSILTPLDTHFD